MLNRYSTGIKISGQEGTWYVIDERVCGGGGSLFLLESEKFGDETASVIVDQYGDVLMDDVWNGFLDWDENCF